jgi:hypothetical protein
MTIGRVRHPVVPDGRVVGIVRRDLFRAAISSVLAPPRRRARWQTDRSARDEQAALPAQASRSLRRAVDLIEKRIGCLPVSRTEPDRAARERLCGCSSSGWGTATASDDQPETVRPTKLRRTMPFHTIR